MRLGDTEDQAAQHRAGQGADPAEDGGGEGFNPDDKPGVKIESAVVHGDQHPCQPGHCRANHEHQGDDPVGINPQNRRHFAILLHGATHPSESGIADDPGEQQHPGERGDQDKDFGVGDLNKAFTNMESQHAVEHGRHALLARPLTDLGVILQDQRHADG